MIVLRQGEHADLVSDGWESGLAGTLTVAAYAGDGTAVLAETSIGIAEVPAGSGRYVFAGWTIPPEGRYGIVWRDPAEATRLATEDVYALAGLPASLDGFGTPDGLAAFQGREAVANTAQATLALEVARGIVADLIGRNIARVDDDVLLLDGNGSSVLLLPAWPVLLVSRVEVAGVELDPAGWEWGATGVLAALGDYRWPSARRNVRVTYSHGFYPIPPEVIGLVYSIATRVCQSPSGAEIRQESIGGYNVSYGPVGTTIFGLSGIESRIIARYRSR